MSGSPDSVNVNRTKLSWVSISKGISFCVMRVRPRGWGMLLIGSLLSFAETSNAEEEPA